jgi:hypothetical protein
MADWTVDSANVAYREGRLQAWIEAYLQVPDWANPGLLRRVRTYSVGWPSPELVPVDRFRTIAGPGSEFRFPKDPEEWEAGVQAILSQPVTIEQLPPVIGWIDADGSTNLADGNHRLDAAKRLGIPAIWALIHPTPLRDPTS